MPGTLLPNFVKFSCGKSPMHRQQHAHYDTQPRRTDLEWSEASFEASSKPEIPLRRNAAEISRNRRS